MYIWEYHSTISELFFLDTILNEKNISSQSYSQDQHVSYWSAEESQLVEALMRVTLAKLTFLIFWKISAGWKSCL